MWTPIKFLLFYHKTAITILTPLLLAPLLILDGGSRAIRCFYIILWMAIYWIFEVMPLGITGMMPVFLFPIFNIMDSRATCSAYFTETTFVFLGGIALAAAIEFSNMHTRIALKCIKLVGCSARRLHIGVFFVTVVISWWVVNTAATAMMLPIVNAICRQLDAQGMYDMYLPRKEEEEDTTIPVFEDEHRRPARFTLCMYLSIAYASTIGGVGTLVGTGTNLVFKGIYETKFVEDKEGVSFVKFMMIGIPNTFILSVLVIMWMQVLYMGLFRPNSVDNKAVSFGEGGIEDTKKLIDSQIEALGKWSFNEIVVMIMFILAILLWIFRRPQFIKGWADLITENQLGDSVPIIVVICLIFLIPGVPSFIYFCSADEEKRPKAPSKGCVTWKHINTVMPWGLLFLLGGGFAIAKAANDTGMSRLVASWLQFTQHLPPVINMFILSAFTTLLTNLISSNISVCNIIMPILIDLSISLEIHPLMFMYPCAVCASWGFCFPISTPPNALVADAINIRTVDMIKAGSVTAIITTMASVPFIYLLTTCLYDLSSFSKEIYT